MGILNSFKNNYYQIADAIEGLREVPLEDDYLEILLSMRLQLEKLGQKVKKDLGAWE